MSDPFTHSQLDRLSQQLGSAGGVDSFTYGQAQSEYQRLNRQVQTGAVTDPITHAKLLRLNQQLQQVRPQQQMQGGAAPAGWQPPTESPSLLRDTAGVALTVIGGLGWLLLPVEALGAAILTWVYLGSAKGLNMRLPNGSAVGGLHWDPFAAIALSLVAGVAWVLLFLVPVAGPLVGLAMSVVWGLVAYVGTGSLGFGLFAFAASMLARMLMRTTRHAWLAVVEWTFVATVAVLALAPIGQAVPLQGLGGWEALRQVHDTQSCDQQLRAGPWKDRYTGTPAFFVDRTACANARVRARGRNR